jgi:hypothetical protein
MPSAQIQVIVEHLPSKPEVPSSNPSTAKKKKLQTHILDEHGYQNSKQNISKLHPTTHKNIIQHLIRFIPQMQGWLSMF